MGKVKRDCKTATNICPQQRYAFVAASTYLCFMCHELRPPTLKYAVLSSEILHL